MLVFGVAAARSSGCLLQKKGKQTTVRYEKPFVIRKAEIVMDFGKTNPREK